MIKELDSSEIIAYCISTEKRTDDFVISYKKIQTIGRILEERVPSLLVTCDLMSIDAFRCEFCHNVEMKEKELKVHRLNEIYSRIHRYMPEPELASKMKKEKLK